MELIWTNDLSVENIAIDNAHKEALGMINRIVRQIESGDVVALPEAFKLLEEGLFAVEENIAQTLGVDFIKHGLAHRRMLNKIRRIKDELAAKNGNWSKLEEIRYIDSLGYYLIRHIRDVSNFTQRARERAEWGIT